ncbi:MAG: hypothetical protein EAZ14_05775 [Runella slithyformis]|nr:MAG: hypothetical protein EAZ14_05775 [Runella slithyformis]
MAKLPQNLKTESPKSKQTESPLSSGGSEMDFDDETLRQRVATYQTNVKNKPPLVPKPKPEKVFHIGLKLNQQFRSDWLQLKYSLALQYGVEISIQKYVEFLHTQAVEKSKTGDFLAEMARYFKAKNQ